MPRPTRSRYVGRKDLMKLEDEGKLSIFECMLLELVTGIRDSMAKPGTLEDKSAKQPFKKAKK